MNRKYLELALNCGYDVVIQLNYCCNARYSGKVIDLDDENFVLLHMNSKTGFQWVFKIEDLRYFGILRENMLPACDYDLLIGQLEDE